VQAEDPKNNLNKNQEKSEEIERNEIETKQKAKTLDKKG